MNIKRASLLAAKFLIPILLTQADAAGAAEIRIVCSNGIKAVMEELIPTFERATKHKVTIRYGLSAMLKRQIDAGEPFDIAILTPTLIDEGIMRGQIAGDTRTVLARSGMGLAIRAGAPRPDIRTTDALKRTLLASKSIAYAREGAGGVFFVELAERLGLRDGLKAKIRPTTTGAEVGSAVARGDAELGVLPLSEILILPGVEVLGTFPADVQGYVVMVAGVSLASRQRAAAQELMRFVTAPAALPVISKRGMELASSQTSPTHELRLLPENVHWGYYDAAVKPVLRVASGDTIRVETMVARGLQRLRAAGVAEDEIPSALKAVENAVTERGPGAHPLTGPVWVEGAEPGDVLEVKILGVEFLHPYGVTGFIPNSGTLPDDFPYARFKLVRFNVGAGTAEFAPGVTLRLAPFFGSIGVAPSPLLGRISSGPPGSHTGNLDNKELVAGSTLYLPVHVRGALLSLGDGHAMQGDGEVTLTALETSLRGTIQVNVRKGKRLSWPRAETPTHYIAMGLHTDLDQAAQLATREMIEFLVTEKGIDRDDAYILCSLAADLRVTQLVDGTKGVHAMMLKSIFAR